MEHVHLFRAAHQHVPDTRDNIDLDIPEDAFFQDLISVTAMDATQKNDWIFYRIYGDELKAYGK